MSSPFDIVVKGTSEASGNAPNGWKEIAEESTVPTGEKQHAENQSKRGALTLWSKVWTEELSTLDSFSVNNGETEFG